MTPEEIVGKINNVEWDSEGDPLYSYDQMIEAMKEYAADQNAELEKRLKELSNTTNDLMKND